MGDPANIRVLVEQTEHQGSFRSDDETIEGIFTDNVVWPEALLTEDIVNIEAALGEASLLVPSPTEAPQELTPSTTPLETETASREEDTESTMHYLNESSGEPMSFRTALSCPASIDIPDYQASTNDLHEFGADASNTDIGALLGRPSNATPAFLTYHEDCDLFAL